MAHASPIALGEISEVDAWPVISHTYAGWPNCLAGLTCPLLVQLIEIFSIHATKILCCCSMHMLKGLKNENMGRKNCFISFVFFLSRISFTTFSRTHTI